MGVRGTPTGDFFDTLRPYLKVVCTLWTFVDKSCFEYNLIVNLTRPFRPAAFPSVGVPVSPNCLGCTWVLEIDQVESWFQTYDCFVSSSFKKFKFCHLTPGCCAASISPGGVQIFFTQGVHRNIPTLYYAANISSQVCKMCKCASARFHSKT